MGGGDLLNLLIERDTFPEDFTRFYVAEVRIPLLEQHPALIFFFFRSTRWYWPSSHATYLVSFTVMSNRMCALSY